MKKTVIIILLLLFSSCSDSINDLLDLMQSNVPICVDGSLATSGDGRGWKNAYNNIQDAVTAAPDGSEIWVKAGTYNLTSTISILKPLSIFGGFNGTESWRKQRNTQNNITTINGTAYPFSFNSVSAGKKILIDGLRITGSYPINLNGVGVGTAFITINNCTFDGITRTGSGAAIYISDSSLQVSNCKFHTCSATSWGGAIYISGASLKISECTFSGCTGVFGGAIFIIESYVSIKSSIFSENEVTGNGGAISVQNTGSPEIIIDNTEFTGNESDLRGGAIDCDRGQIEINRSKFNDNTAGTRGGAISHYNNSGLLVSKIKNSIFYNNNADQEGGAMYLYSGNASDQYYFVNLTFHSNTATSTGSSVFAQYIESPLIITFYNSIFYDNPASLTLINGTSLPDLVLDYCFYNGGLTSGASANASCIYDTANSPFLSVAPADNRFLYPASICRDAGLNTAPGLPATDIGGFPRIANGTVDMGAYEWQ